MRKGILQFFLIIATIVFIFFISKTVLHASSYKEHMIEVQLGEVAGETFQVEFENAEIEGAYSKTESGYYSSITPFKKYNNIFQHKNYLISGSVVSGTIYFKVKTDLNILNSSDIKYRISSGSKINPFDYSKIDLSKGNVINVSAVKYDEEGSYSKVFLRSDKHYVVKGYGYNVRVENKVGEEVFDSGRNSSLTDFFKTFEVEEDGFYYLVSKPSSKDNDVNFKLTLSQIGIESVNLKPVGLNESFEKTFYINIENTDSISFSIDNKLDYESSDYLFKRASISEHYSTSEYGGDDYYFGGLNSDITESRNNRNVIYTHSESKLLEVSYFFESSIYEEKPQNEISINNIFRYKPKIGSSSKKEVQEIKADDRESSEIGDPVDAFRGNFVDRKTLLSYSGDDALSFDMNYDSIANDSQALASGFTHNFETKLIRKDDEVSILWNPNAITKMNFVNGEWKAAREKDKYRLFENDNGYRVVEDENEYIFDLDGKILSQDNGKGQKLRYSYVGNVLSEVKNQRGQLYQFEYVNGKLKKVTDLANRSVQFVYDTTSQQLNKVIYPNNKELVLSYQSDTKTNSSPAKLKKMVFDGKTLVDNTYNLIGAVDYQYDGNGNKTTFVYDEWSNPDEITTTLTNANGTTTSKTHNSSGQVIREKNERGYERTFQYDSKGNIIEESDFKGNLIRYEYDNAGNLVKMINPDDSVIINAYDSNGLITKTTDVDALNMEYAYNEKQQPVKMTDKEGVETSFVYDELGHIIRQESAGKVLEREYDASGNLIKIKLPDGSVSIHEYDSLGRQTSTTLSGGTKIETVYDTMNNVLKQINPDGTFVSYEYDGFGKKTKETDQIGRTTTYTYDTNGNLLSESKGLRGVTYRYDSLNRLISKSYKSASGTVNLMYDNAGNLIEETDENSIKTLRTYNENNQVLTEKVGSDVTTFEYDVMGRVSKQVDAEGNETKYTYNSSGLLSKEISPSGNETTYSYDKMGRQTELIDPMNNVYKTEYNQRGEKVKDVNPLGFETSYQYDENGKVTSVTNALGETSTIIYNELGQVIEQKNALGESVAKMSYDASGRVVKIMDGNGNESRMVYDAVGNLIESYNAEGNLIAKNEFNEFNELIKTTNALNASSSYQYNLRGFQTKVTDAMGFATDYTYYNNGQLSTSKDANATTAYSYYDSKGRLTRNLISSFENRYAYNKNDQVVLETMPGGNTLAYTYNPESLLIERKNGRGELSNYEYDKNGNLIKEITKEGTILRTYDVLNREIKSESPSGVIERKYDALNRVVEKTQNGKRIGYEYDKRGHLVQMTYPDGKKVSYTYDVMGNLLTVTDWRDNVTTYSYNKNNQLLKTIHSNGVVEEREYNVGGQLTSVKSIKNDVLITHFTYEYDLNGNITKEVDVKNGKDNVYTYDKLGRLTNANTNSYTYSPTGNVTSYQITQNGQSISRTMTYNSDNQLSKVGSDATSIDKDGNLLTYKLNGKTYVATYDSQNKMIQAGNQYFQYDSEGNRIGIRKTNGSGVTTSEVSMVVDNDSHRLSRNLVESSADGDIYYVYGHGLISEHKGEAVNTYHFDYRGSTVAMTNQSGEVIGEAEYDEYGVVLKSTIVTRYMYNGQFGIENDGDGLYYMRTRFYNVDLKKFMNRDVVMGNIQESQSLNRYAYVNGNPVNFTDPFGMARETVENTQAQANGVNMETIHFVLDMIGMIPALGEFADAANVVLYMAEDNYKMAALSAAAMVPVIGSLATGGKIATKVLGKIDTSKDVIKKSVSSGWGWLKKTGSSVSGWVKNKANKLLDARIPTGPAYEMAGVGRVQNDTSLREAYQLFAGKGKPRKDRLPKTKGKWVGEPGNGEWYSDKQEVLNITKGKPVVFKDNKPDFTPWAVEELDFPKGVLTGNHGKDDRLADKWIQDKYGFKTQDEAKNWRTSNGYTFHHVSDVKGQMVPRALHQNVPHTGGAAYIRNK